LPAFEVASQGDVEVEAVFVGGGHVLGVFLVFVFECLFFFGFEDLGVFVDFWEVKIEVFFEVFLTLFV
jgi:hypothetical protein